MSRSRTIAVLGAGVGGITAANELRRRLPREHRIVLVEKNVEHAFAPSFLWLLTGDRAPARIVTPVERLLRGGVEFLPGEITGIDVAARRVVRAGESIDYDYLVIALGAELAPELIPGLQESAHSFYTFEGARTLRDAVAAFEGGTIAIVVGALPYKCPAAPHEAAMLLADHVRRRGLARSVAVNLYTPEPMPMPVAGPELGSAVTAMLASRGVSFHPLHVLASVDPGSHELAFNGRDSARYDLLAAIPPHRAPRIVRDAGLTNASGWIPVDRATLATAHAGVFAIGDVTAIAIPGRWKPDVPMMLPKAGVFAHAQGTVVAARIAEEILGRAPRATFSGMGYCMLEAGAGAAGFAVGDFYAEPSPRLQLRTLGRRWHLGKVLFERWWLAPIGIRKTLLHALMTGASKALRIPI
jgi:sulfide:quinone oxidoreductase